MMRLGDDALLPSCRLVLSVHVCACACCCVACARAVKNALRELEETQNRVLAAPPPPNGDAA